MALASGAQASIRDPTDQSNLPASAAGLAGLRPAITWISSTTDAACLQREGEQGRETGPHALWSRSFVLGPLSCPMRGNRPVPSHFVPRILLGRFGRRDGSQGQADRRIQAIGEGHRFARGPDRALQRAHQGAHRAPEDSRQGPPLPPRPPAPGWQATASAELPEGHRRGALPRPRREARDQEIRKKPYWGKSIEGGLPGGAG